ncbi:MAG: hypothetical protein ACRDGF_07275, partial [Chloroflexota bacterium]
VAHVSVSLSDELRAAVRERGLSTDRPNLRAVGHELRMTQGHGVLAERVLARLDAETGATVALIDAIRTPAELQLLQRRRRDSLTLVAVGATEDVLVRRLRSRGRSGDDELTAEGARALLQAEMGRDEPEYGFNVAACIALADVTIDNSGSLEDLRGALTQLADERLGAGSPR